MQSDPRLHHHASYNWEIFPPLVFGNVIWTKPHKFGPLYILNTVWSYSRLRVANKSLIHTEIWQAYVPHCMLASKLSYPEITQCGIHRGGPKKSVWTQSMAMWWHTLTYTQIFHNELIIVPEAVFLLLTALLTNDLICTFVVELFVMI